MTDRHDLANRLYGCGTLDKVFTNHDRVVAPWPRAPRRKHQPAFDRSVLAGLEGVPADLVEVDPRCLWSSQPWVLRGHVAYYLTGRWERTGLTSADRHIELNRFPVVIEQGARMVIAAGHHRATAALIDGRPLLVRQLATRGMFAVTPLLWWEPGADTDDAASVVGAVAAGRRRSVGSLEAAAEVLVGLGVPDAEVRHRTALLARQADRHGSAWHTEGEGSV